MMTNHDLREEKRVEDTSPRGGRSVGLAVVFFGWFGLIVALGILQMKVAAVVLSFGGCLVAWATVLAVAAVTEPPRPLAETSILAQRIVWLVRAGWATVVIICSAVVSAIVAVQVQEGAGDPYIWTVVLRDLLAGIVAPVLLMAAVIASSTIPFQLIRVGADARRSAARRLLRPLGASGFPTYWAERLIHEITAPLIGFVTCYMGPVIVTALALIATT